MRSQPGPAPAWLLERVVTAAREPYVPRPVRTGGGTTPYGKKALDDECARISSAPAGTQDVTFRDRSLCVFSLVAGGEIDASEAETALLNAGMSMVNYEPHNPWRERVLLAKLAKTREVGARSPRSAPPREPAKLTLAASGGTPRPKREAGPPAMLTPVPDTGNWREGLPWVLSESGRVALKESANAGLFIEHHPGLRGCFAYNEWADEVLVLRPPPGRRSVGYPRPLTDEDCVLLLHWLSSQRYGIRPLPSTLQAAIVALAKEHWPFNPLTGWLQGLEWDGTLRIDGWLVRYAGAADDLTARLFGRKFLISAVARALKPGCKVDTMLCLEGPQGAGKSRLLRALAGDAYFTDQTGGDLASKDASQNLQGMWLIELAEMDRYMSARESAVKGFLSRQEDRYRPPYGRNVITRPRRCVFTGSINVRPGSGYLSDPTGARRVWPVAVGKIDVDAMQADRDQLWAEARHYYDHGEFWWPDGAAEEALAEAVQEERAEVDPWEGKLVERMGDANGFRATHDILWDWLTIPTERHTVATSKRLAGIMLRLDVKSKVDRVNGQQKRGYWFGPAEDDT